MKKIVILGAGRSSSSLIKYLLEEGKHSNWLITLADFDKAQAESKIIGYQNAVAVAFDIFNETQREALIREADLVISMLPAAFHIHVAKTCLDAYVHLFTASYVSTAIRELDEEAKRKELLFLNECGLDPGLDHMSAMQLIEQIRGKGGELRAFCSYTGGLVAPESDDNPWNYKFSWNPRNVVLAGQGVAKYLSEGYLKFIPYHKLFSRSQSVFVEGLGDFDAYPNRDSLAYREIYGLEKISTLLRGTLRRAGFCAAWDVFVQLGMTDDSFQMKKLAGLTWRQFTDSFLPKESGMSLEEKLANYLNIPLKGEIMSKLTWLGIFEDKALGVKEASPAQVLLKLLEEKWKLKADDKDMIVMQHQLDYELEGKIKRLTSSLVVKGEDPVQTAMAKTVGLPLGIAVKMFLQEKIKARGVQIPINKDFYDPILSELKDLGIAFNEKEEELKNQ
ncbi:saccharopine dehydrogenase family protein [Xanthovirga aplysinae]|uniref:saccharopine dehydrogenase family protein n=1 Tax=Xanthovirga aplysinae TaxID=2529853 RepID=UPI0012BC94DF|nr:saccharopine dehydrogenase C-terminal domain-containing protein [Xanthovirga aplysinae]MTI30024.1 saccharopine dehydrogenase [Xanthovirga aplysinae]